jgi:hypothetical protein
MPLINEPMLVSLGRVIHSAVMLERGKTELSESPRASGYEVEDYGAYELDSADDYPDFIIPLARAVGAARVERGVALCGSGVGASVAANKVPGVRAGLIHDVFSRPSGRRRRRYEYSLSRRKGDRVRACLGTDRNFSTCSLQRSPSPPTSVGEGQST